MKTSLLRTSRIWIWGIVSNSGSKGPIETPVGGCGTLTSPNTIPSEPNLNQQHAETLLKPLFETTYQERQEKQAKNLQPQHLLGSEHFNDNSEMPNPTSFLAPIS